MKISGSEIKRRLREGRWHWWLPAAFFAGIGFLPSGWIEASPGEVFRPPVLFAPMAWPLFAMGLVFGAAAFSLRLRRHAWHVLFLGTGAALLFNLLLIASSGAVALYSWELGADLQNRIFLDFELNILAFFVHPMVLLLLALSGLVLWVRGGKPGPEELQLYFPIENKPAPAPELPAVPVPAEAKPGEAGVEAKPPEIPGEAGKGAPEPPSEPASPLDAITKTAPEPVKEEAGAKPAEGQEKVDAPMDVGPENPDERPAPET